MAGQVFGGKAVATAFAIGKRLQQRADQADPTVKTTFHEMTRDVATGKILANPQVKPPTELAMMMSPQMAAIMALEAAISVQFDELHEHLDVIEDKVDELLRLASAEQIGDVYGRHGLLASMVQELAAGHVLTTTDWSAIAGLGTDLAVGVERLRAHTVSQLETLEHRAGAGRRSEQLADLLVKNRLGQTLKLLVVAQKSLFLWQKLRLENVRNTEEQYLDQTIASARDALQREHAADLRLVELLREVVEKFAVLRLTEAHQKLVGRRLRESRGELSAMLEGFIATRNLQVEQRDGPEDATLGQAFAFARKRSAEMVTIGRQQVARGASALAAFVEPEQADEDEESNRPASGDERDRDDLQ